MLKKLSAYIGKYKLQALLSPILVLFEVVLEVFIPLLMGKIVDVGIPNKDFGYILKMGGLMVVMAIGALVFGALCARVAVVASNGMATNLRKGLFTKIESFSFKNTDHFTTPSLITRLTNDVNNIQNSFQMIIRMLARAVHADSRNRDGLSHQPAAFDCDSQRDSDAGNRRRLARKGRLPAL